MRIDPLKFEGFSGILGGVVVPRPIALVSTTSTGGANNLAPFSFFNVVSYTPPTLMLAISRFSGEKRERPKDTLWNIEQTGEFVVNVVVDEIAEAMVMTAGDYPANVDEFKVAGLTPVPSERVRPPRVAESPVNMECRLSQLVPVGKGKGETMVVLGEVLLLHVRDDLIQGERVDPHRLKAVGRLVGNLYCRTHDIFEAVRPS
ncbi:MAG: flavin reductase family protein [Chloroflexi bacterium]|nr:flavin reductase family protein [Chloroflexota bacterium]